MIDNNKKCGAVVVVGGGIGGMQASLDLAEGGYKVYLVEKSPAIGGKMSQLDKTFPTNDCAMCTLAPRLIDVGGHLDIEKITNAEVEKVEGSPGNFKVTIKKRARYIDLTKCTGCSACVEKCPVVVDSEFDLQLVKRTAIYRRYPQAVPGAFAVDKRGVAPCRVGCPGGVNAHAYVSLIAQHRFDDALEVVRRTLPFPSICGRLCHHPCEEECNRNEVDQAVNIRSLKSFIADRARIDGESLPRKLEPTRPNEKVATVGAGPAGLTCALRLLEKGYPVTVFDAADKPGGMLTSCIPEYRASSTVTDYDLERLIAHGIEIRTNTRIGEDVELAKLRDEYKAVFIAIGYQEPARLPIEGARARGVLYGIAFLKEARANRKVEDFGRRVIIIGGGNVAIDCARTAVRLGAQEVDLVCLETRNLGHKDRMPAHWWEIEEAEEEGVKIHGSLGPKKILASDGGGCGLQTVHCTSVYELSDQGKRFAPTFSDEPAPVLEGDTIIIAIGQTADTTGFEDLEKTPRKTFRADGITLETNLAGVFAGGDIVRGPASVIEAVAHGNEAAISIDRYLNNRDLREGRIGTPEMAGLPERKIEKAERIPILKREARKRKQSFDEVELGLDEEQAVREASRCLACAVCSECLMCVEACEAEAIDHEMEKEEIEILSAGAIVLAPGYRLFPPELRQEYGYGRYANVVSSLQFERILSASGPYAGKVLRPSDQKTPKKIAWIQCVGSRDELRNYCSAVCCMYATKEAIIAKEHEPDLECTIFFIDLRAFGKGYDKYYTRAKKLGVSYVRCRPSSIREVPGTGNLKIHYVREDDQILTEEFDMVVLSAGMRPPEEVHELADRFGIKLDEHGFAVTQRFSPVETTKAGVYVCGPFSEPKDIPETVMQASASASEAMALLSEERGTLITRKEYPPEKNVSGQEPAIGVFVCHCGKNIGGVADVPAVVEYTKSLPNVVHAEDSLYTCSVDTQRQIKKVIEEKNLNRVVVASCTPRTHEPLFRNTCREAGLNEYLFEMANIRDQNTWVHMHEPDKATQKAKDLVRIAVTKARLLEPLQRRTISLTHSALVIGAGLSGMTAALNLAEQGIEVHLVEKGAEPGGQLRHLYYLIDDEDPRQHLNRLITKIRKHPKINLYTDAKVAAFEGSYGNFKSKISFNGSEKQIDHGAVVVATGADEYKPTEYLYGKNDRVLTQRELEEKLAKKELPTSKSEVRTVVMIQCVGSRQADRPYCSRVCCQHAVKNALKIRELYPEIDVFVLYRDVRTYGFREKYYTRAREQGVRFINYEEDRKPQVSAQNGRLQVKVHDTLLGRDLIIHPDLIVLAPAVIPREGVGEVAKLLKIPLNQEKFFLEAHMKLRPIDFATEGIFLCGLAHAPKLTDESIAQASGAASRAMTILAKDELKLEAAISQVADKNCDGCAYCIDPCPFKALTLVEYMSDGVIKKTVDRDEAKCKGCGVCQATCPKKGIFIRHFKLDTLAAMVDAALETAS